MTIFIGGAWPYANGSLHLGHIAALLPGDILARYYRQKGEEVLYVSGSDCHGTPIALRAAEEDIEPEEIADKYHQEFVDCFDRLGFTYDLYSRTDREFHHRRVKEIFRKLYDKDYLYTKKTEQLYCDCCQRYLPDRYVEGTCPHCGGRARGDQCDDCSRIVDPLELEERECKICGGRPLIKETEQFYLALSRFQSFLENFLAESENWRGNAVRMTESYLREGLEDRAVSRDLSWGIEVPITGYEGKSIYVWVEAVLGYLTASQQWAEKEDGNWESFWQGEVTSYYVHGKDNIPFHSIILPVLLEGLDLHLPDRIVASEYLQIERKKLSTSRNWAVWVPYLLDNYNPDSIRYFLTVNGPEKRDSNFSWEAFIHSHNGELLGAFGNFVNRTLKFVEKYYDSLVPEGEIDERIARKIRRLYGKCGKEIEDTNFKNALRLVFDFIREANKYFDEERPWITVEEEPDRCARTINTCIQIIANLGNLLAPFIPFSAQKTREFLGTGEPVWEFVVVEPETPIVEVEKLFTGIEKEKIEEEVERLKKRSVE